jgi:hypothetical protein
MKKSRDRRTAKHYSVRGVEQPVAPADEPRAVSEKAAQEGDGAKDDPEENRRSVRVFLIGAAQAAIIIPVLFFLRFGEINAFALSFTAFIVVLLLLVALGYSTPDKTAGQTPVKWKGGPLNYVGAFWLLACAFGPFFGWLMTTSFVALTEGNWWWRYVARAVLSVGVPVLTALPLFLYVRGKYWYVVLMLLLGLTSLSAWSGVNTVLDLREGPVVRQTTGYYNASDGSFYPDAQGQLFKLTILSHTQRSIKIEPSSSGEGK